MLDAQVAPGQPRADLALRSRRHAEALRILRGGHEAVVARARAIEEAAQERVLRVGVGVGEHEPDAHALGGRRRAAALGLREAPRDIGDEDPIGRGGARHRGDGGEQHECADDLSHATVNAAQAGNLLGLRAR